MINRIALVPSILAGLLLIASCEEFTDELGGGVPAELQQISQSTVAGQAGEPLAAPLRVRVVDGAGEGVAGITIEWTSTGGNVSPETTTTDATGHAEAGWTLGTVLGQFTAEASSAGLDEVTFTADVGPGRPASLQLSHVDASFDALDQTLDVDATGAQDGFGNTITSPSVTWTTTNAGVATVSPNGVITAEGNGTATITATADTATATVHVSVEQLVSSVTVSPDAQTIEVGATLQLTATALDANDNAVADATFTFSSLNTGVATVDGTGLVTGEAEGVATIRANSDGAVADAVITVATDVNPGDCPIVGAIALGETADGVLQEGDCSPDGVSFMDVWSLDLTAETTVQIDMTSLDIDTRLVLMDGTGSTLIDQSDDGAGGTDARIDITLAAGSYRIGATAAAGHTGGYTLSVIEPAEVTGCENHGTLGLDDSGTGTIDSSDCELDAEFAIFGEKWELELTEDTVAVIDLTSTEVDVFILVQDLSGSTIGFNDDIPDGTDAHLELPLGAGTYVVYAVNVSGGSGSYSLDISGGTTPDCVFTGALGVPESVGGVLDLNDCLFVNGSREDYWDLTVGTGGTIEITMRSSDVDSYLVVFDGAGNFIAEDDDTGGGANDTDAQITTSLAAGTYIVLATTFGGGDRGAYTLSTAAVSADASAVSADRGGSPAVKAGGGLPWLVERAVPARVRVPAPEDGSR